MRLIHETRVTTPRTPHTTAHLTRWSKPHRPHSKGRQNRRRKTGNGWHGGFQCSNHNSQFYFHFFFDSQKTISTQFPALLFFVFYRHVGVSCSIRVSAKVEKGCVTFSYQIKIPKAIKTISYHTSTQKNILGLILCCQYLFLLPVLLS